MIARGIESDPKWSAEHLIYVLAKSFDVHAMLREVDKASDEAVKCRAFQMACEHGVFEEAKRIVEIADGPSVVRDSDNLAFRLACENGNLDIAQWMFARHNDIIDVHVLQDYAFRVACQNGHWESAKWVATIAVPNALAIRYAFYEGCRKGHLQIVKWLVHDFDFDGRVVPPALSHPTLTVFERGFWDACASNHLDIAQWLFSLGVVDLDGHRSRVWWYYQPVIILWLHGLDPSRDWDAAFMAKVHESNESGVE